MKHAPLWKRLLREGALCDVPGYNLSETLRAPIIVDGRPAERMHESLRADAIGRVSIPFPEFWLETQDHFGISIGTHVRAVRTDDGFDLQMFGFMGSPARKVRLIVEVAATLDHHGDPDRHPEGGLRHTIMPALNMITVLPEKDWQMAAFMFLYSTLDTLMILGCKNVGMARRQFDADTGRAASRKLGGTDHRYHVLVVRSAGAKADSPGIELGTMPRHVCRGHFAEYGPEFNKGLLFGRLSGRFYVPPHLKGKTEIGTVSKDYAVVGAAS